VSQVSAHVLDARLGVPAAGVGVTLLDAAGTVLAQTVTDGDGRVRDLGPERLEEGTYAVRFASGAYFDAQDVASFHPEVLVTFRVLAGETHHHIPLLLSPYAYTTYRGS
jgi:5-hydroxyisourate hydrolase